jgi:hypothetical protein
MHSDETFGWQTCICHHVFHCRNFHLSLCGHGCIGFGQMEDGNNNVSATCFPLVLFWSLLSLVWLAIAISHQILQCCSVGQSFGLFSTLLVFILVGRAAFVFPLSALSNYMCKSASTKIGVRQQVPALPFINYALPLDFHEAIVLMMSLHLHFVGRVDFQLCMIELLFTCFQVNGPFWKWSLLIAVTPPCCKV